MTVLSTYFFKSSKCLQDETVLQSSQFASLTRGDRKPHQKLILRLRLTRALWSVLNRSRLVVSLFWMLESSAVHVCSQKDDSE